MRTNRTGYAIGASLVGLALFLTAPDHAASQEIVRSGISADRPLSYHLSALSSNSFFSRNGIWIRHDGMWAFRPHSRYDSQSYFRCRMGYGCGGYGWASYGSRIFGSWLPYGYAGWDLVSGGWMWFPGRRLSTHHAWDLFWDLWFIGPRYGYGAYGSGFPFSLDGGLLRIARGTIPGHRWDLRQDVARFLNGATHGDRWDRFPAEGGFTGETEAPGRTRAQVHPLQPGPVVTLGADPKAPEDASGDRRALKPHERKNADLTPRTLRPGVESRSRSPSDATAHRGSKTRQTPARPAARRPASPRSTPAAPKATGRSRPASKAIPTQPGPRSRATPAPSKRSGKTTPRKQ